MKFTLKQLLIVSIVMATLAYLIFHEQKEAATPIVPARQVLLHKGERAAVKAPPAPSGSDGKAEARLLQEVEFQQRSVREAARHFNQRSEAKPLSVNFPIFRREGGKRVLVGVVYDPTAPKTTLRRVALELELGKITERDPSAEEMKDLDEREKLMPLAGPTFK